MASDVQAASGRGRVTRVRLASRVSDWSPNLGRFVLLGFLVLSSCRSAPVNANSICPVSEGRLTDLPEELTRSGGRWLGAEPLFVVHGYSERDAIRQPDGTYPLKVGWWRGSAGQLNISAVRLDRAGTLMSFEATSQGYDATGFLPSSVPLPAKGCWQISGELNGAKATTVFLLL
jgi:hypothetical protein